MMTKLLRSESFRRALFFSVVALLAWLTGHFENMALVALTTTANIPALLLPGVRKLKGEYRQIKTQWSQVFAQGKSEMQVERTAHMRYLPLPQLKTQGAPTQFDNLAGQRFVYNHVHVAIGLGYAFTREALDDNLYRTQFNPANLGLLRSFRQMKEILAAAVFNNGNVTTAGLGADNVPLFATNHPVDGFLIANTPTQQIGLNENSIMMGNNQIRRFRDNAGLLQGAQGRMLLVPVELRHLAKRLVDTPLRPGTANNDVASLKENNDLENGYLVMDFLTSPFAWFILSDQGGAIYLERKPFETSMQVEFTTDQLLVKAYERYYLGYDDWRLGWGSFPLN